jgi:hypothetical protein
VTLDDLPPGDEDEGIEVIQIMEAIVGNRNETHIVNVVNGGTIPNLPPDAIVEVNASVNAYGVRPVYTGPLPEPLAAHLREYVALQKQMVKAALTGNRTAVSTPSCLSPRSRHDSIWRTQRRCWMSCSPRMPRSFPQLAARWAGAAPDGYGQAAGRRTAGCSPYSPPPRCLTQLRIVSSSRWLSWSGIPSSI